MISSSVDYVGSKLTPFVEGRYYRAFGAITLGHVLRIISETGYFKKIVFNRKIFANIALCLFLLVSVFITFYKPHRMTGEIVFLLATGAFMIISENIARPRESSLIKNGRIIVNVMAKKTYPLYLYQEAAFFVMGMLTILMEQWNPFFKGFILMCVCLLIALIMDSIASIPYWRKNVGYKEHDA